MEPKFILTLDGHLRIGNVQMHKDLLLPNDTCIGGGFWEVDRHSCISPWQYNHVIQRS